MTAVRGRQHRVAIVGSGASGVLTAVNLLRRGEVDTVTLYERDTFGGAAYRTESPHHVLNVRAAQMSGLADEPLSFVQWAQAQGLPVSGTEFLPRSLFRQYLSELLRRAAARSSVDFQRVTCDVTDLQADRNSVQVHAGGTWSTAEKVVLAVGNPPPAPLPAFSAVDDHPALIADPWRPGALASVASDAPVLVIGTGLTAADVVLDLDAQGHRGDITLISRRGKLPQAHCPDPCPRTELALPERPQLDEVIRAVEIALQTAAAHGRCAHGVIDGLRPITQELWRGFSTADKDRFLRTIRPWWDRHRHRVAPAVGGSLQHLIDSGRLVALQGTLAGLEPTTAGLAATVATGGTTLTFDAAAVINCTGPAPLALRRDGGLVPALLQRGSVRIDPWGMGIDTTDRAEVIDRYGAISRTMYAVGPLRRGTLFESTAIPEIRQQAAALAEQLSADALAVPA